MTSRFAFLIAFLFALALSAASVSSDAMNIRFPEAIQVGETSLPAGDYAVRALDNPNGTAVLSITSENGTSILIVATRVATHHENADTRTEAVLARVNGTLHLQGFRFAARPYVYRLLER